MKKILVAVVLILIAIQFIPAKRTNPEITFEIDLSGELKSVFKKSCYDCHSNETNWPWYSYVAPVSWLVIKDVNDGRKHLNFSEWGNLERKKQAKKREEIWEEVENENMPMWNYKILHPDAKLSDKEKSLIRSWSGE